MSHGDPSYPGNEITTDEWKILHNKPVTATAINIAKNINVQNGFSVGETLIVINKRDNKPYTANDGVTPQKWQVIHKDDCGMIYCKRITQGRLGKGIEIIATWDFKNTQFVQDPDIIEHVLLGNEADYDPFAKSRALANLRQRITKHNNEFSLKFESAQESQQWIDTVPVGTTFWHGSESDRMQYEVIGRVHQPLQSWQNVNTLKVNILQVKNGNGITQQMQSYEFSSRYTKYYREKPRVFREEMDTLDMSKQRKPRKAKVKNATV